MRRQHGNRGVNLGVMLLLYQLMSVGLEHIPPVTLTAILAQAAIFMGFVPNLDPYYATHQYCIRADRIWYRLEWWRVLPAVVMHTSDMHLYFNMISLLWKGRKLERRLGSMYFLYLLVVFAALCSCTMVGLSLLIEEYLDIRGWHLMQQCAVGFSGVLFALKVLTNHYYPYEQGRLLGWIPVASRWACWAELALIQIMVPQASFIGHLSGILVGMAYVCGPLKTIMDVFMIPENEYNRRPPGRRAQNGPRFWGGGQATGRGQERNTGGHGTGTQAGQQYNEYTGGLSEEEQIRRAMQESANEQAGRRQPTAPPYPQGGPPGPAAGGGPGPTVGRPYQPEGGYGPASGRIYPDIGFRF